MKPHVKPFEQRKSERLEEIQAQHDRLGGGKMYQIIGGEVMQVIRHGNELLPITNPLIAELPGQQSFEV